MTLWAIVPVKPLRRGKSRLAGTLTEDERTELNRSLLQHTLETLSGLKEVDEVLVISRDQNALTMARGHGARTVQEDSQSQLNTALKRATVVAKMYTTRAVLVLPADLPLITQADIHELIKRADEADGPVVVIAPDRHGKGTNALLISPPGLIEYDFGGDSFHRHCEMAKAAGARLEVVNLTSLGLDLDLPEDFELIKRLEGTIRM
jgi:2-phospho-L-lactate guanylyltransferase